MARNVCITAADGQTGYLIAELLLTNEQFSKQIGTITGFVLDPSSPKSKDLEELGVKVVHHVPGKPEDLLKLLKESEADTLCVIPPAHKDKFDITLEVVETAMKAEMPNVCLISSAGADLAERETQPRLREFIDIEHQVLTSKGDPDLKTGHSPVVIRAGFYMENLLLYSPQAKKESTLPLPIGDKHKFAPVALGDVALVAAHVLSGKGEQGFDDKHRGQLITLTGPMLAAGNELAEAASQALGEEMHFQDISPEEAEKVLQEQSESDASEIQYLLEYYSLISEGKTNYISTNAFHDITGQHAQEPTEWFKIYAEEFKAEHANKKQRRSE